MKIPKEFIKVIRQAADEMSNNGCNDFEVSDTPENRKFIKAMNKQCCDEDGQELNISDDGQIYCYDWIVLDYIARLLEKE